MSTDEEAKIQRWWDIIKDSDIIANVFAGRQWGDLTQNTQIAIKKAYRAAAKLDNLSVDRAGITFIGKIPEGHAVEFIVRSDRSACLKATPPDGGKPRYYELGGGYDWKDIQVVGSMVDPVTISRKYNGRKLTRRKERI